MADARTGTGTVQSRTTFHPSAKEIPMTIKVGDRVPEGKFAVMTNGAPGSISTRRAVWWQEGRVFLPCRGLQPTC